VRDFFKSKSYFFDIDNSRKAIHHSVESLAVQN
jgi:hypothetical protein